MKLAVRLAGSSTRVRVHGRSPRAKPIHALLVGSPPGPSSNGIPRKRWEPEGVRSIPSRAPSLERSLACSRRPRFAADALKYALQFSGVNFDGLPDAVCAPAAPRNSFAIGTEAPITCKNARLVKSVSLI